MRKLRRKKPDTLDAKLKLRRLLRGPMTAVDWLVAQLVYAIVWGLRRRSLDQASDFVGGLARKFGPLLPVSRTGRTNLAAAFPEKTEAEREEILRGVWDNLGRTAAEYAHLDHIWDYDPATANAGRIVTASVPLFERLRDDGKGALVFAAHMANWELPAIAAQMHGLEATALYRIPNNRYVAEAVLSVRTRTMGGLLAADADAVFQMARIVEAGGHLGMLVDQHWTRGVDVTFFGRPCKANPTLARLARHFDVPVIGARVQRLPGNRFRLEATEPLELPRDAAGRVDVQPTMQMITTILEGWIREAPEQWLWLHRRWR